MLEISDRLGRHQSGLYRELKRNAGQRGYRPKQAHEFALERRSTATYSKWTREVERYVIKALEADLSPK